MPRRGSTLIELNAIMRRCSDIMAVRYVRPTIHPGFKSVVAIDLFTTYETAEFSITNHPNDNFDLTVAVNEYLDRLEETE